MYVKVKQTSCDSKTMCKLNVTKKTTIEDIRKLITKKMKVSSNFRLFFKGKVLVDGHMLSDLNVMTNSMIQLMMLPKLVEPETEAIENSEFFKVGDIIDARDVDGHSSTCGWLEGTVTKIARYTGGKGIAGGDGLTYFVGLDKYPDDKDTKFRVENIRPRARYVYKFEEMREGMKVFVNHNIENPGKRGGWFDAEIEKITEDSKTVVVTLDASLLQRKVVTLDASLLQRKVSFADLINIRAAFVEEIMRIEEPVKLKDRTEQMEEDMNKPVERKNPFKCDCCEDKVGVCKDCGCSICGNKDDPERTLICDECELGYCTKCLQMDEMPTEEQDWYCLECVKKADDVNIVEVENGIVKKSNENAAEENLKDMVTNNRKRPLLLGVAEKTNLKIKCCDNKRTKSEIEVISLVA